MCKIVGNINTLFGVHGDVVNKDKILDAIKYMTLCEEINVDEINKASESGGIYVKENGRILDTFDDMDEYIARYKIVPTGLKLRYTDYPLFAGFIKLNGFWEGAFIGTGSNLYTGYREHYSGGDWCHEHEKIWTEAGRYSDILGFGFAGIGEAVKNESEPNEYIDKEENSAKLEEVIEKALKNSADDSISKSNRLKNTKKANRMRAHMEKVRKREEIEAALKKEEETVKEEEIAITEEPVTIEELGISIEELDNSEIEESKRPDYVNETKQLAQLDSDLEHNEFIASQVLKDLSYEIYEKLLMKERWIEENRHKLPFYLRGIFTVIEHSRQRDGYKHRGNGYVYNMDSDKCIVNTNLLDKYGNYIYLIDHTPAVVELEEKILTVMQSKSRLLNMGFAVEDVKRLPDAVRIANDNRDLMFNADIEDFDFDDSEHLYHIISERIGRFPEKYRAYSEIELCERLKEAVRIGVKISKTDFRYVLPKYDFFRQTIQFLIPFHLDTSFDEAPELTIVVGEQDGIWSIYTVLYTSDAYFDSRLICNPNDTWIRRRA